MLRRCNAIGGRDTYRAGSPLTGRLSQTLDDARGFMRSSHTPILLDQPFLIAPFILFAVRVAIRRSPTISASDLPDGGQHKARKL